MYDIFLLTSTCAQSLEVRLIGLFFSRCRWEFVVISCLISSIPIIKSNWFETISDKMYVYLYVCNFLLNYLRNKCSFKYLKILTTNLHGLVNFQKFDWSTISCTWNLRVLGELLRKLNTAATDTPQYSREKNWWVKNWQPALRDQWERIAWKL